MLSRDKYEKKFYNYGTWLSLFYRFFQLFEKYGGYKAGHLKLKKPKQLQEILDIARDLLNESGHDHNPEVQEKKAKLRQLKLVLEM